LLELLSKSARTDNLDVLAQVMLDAALNLGVGFSRWKWSYHAQLIIVALCCNMKLRDVMEDERWKSIWTATQYPSANKHMHLGQDNTFKLAGAMLSINYLAQLIPEEVELPEGVREWVSYSAMLGDQIEFENSIEETLRRIRGIPGYWNKDSRHLFYKIFAPTTAREVQELWHLVKLNKQFHEDNKKRNPTFATHSGSSRKGEETFLRDYQIYTIFKSLGENETKRERYSKTITQYELETGSSYFSATDDSDDRSEIIRQIVRRFTELVEGR